MKAFKIVLFSLFFFTSYNSQASDQVKNIAVIATGGTIAGSGDSEVGSKYSGAKVSIDKIIKNIPNISKLANVSAEQLFQVNSQDLNDELWLKIANRTNELLSKSSVDGVVITHGTDTMEETAYFLNLVVKSKKPVILVGSMRPSTSSSADGTLNLYNAIALAGSDEAYKKGVLILMNDEIYTARDASKTHTTNVASFKANNSGPIGFVYYGKVEIYYNSTRLHTSKSEFSIKNLSELPKVDILYAYVNSESSVVDQLVASGAKAIIVAGVGDGNVNKKTLEKLSAAQKKGVIIVRSSRVGVGLVEPNVEISDDDLGFVTADNLSPQKARILTMMALTKTDDLKKIRVMFEKY